MNYKRSKYFTTPNKKKIKYLLVKKNSQITVVFFHGFMSDMIGAKPTAIQKFCRKHKINFLKFEYSGHGRSSGKFIEGNITKWTYEAKTLIKAKIKKNNDLIFIGSSMGSWIALTKKIYNLEYGEFVYPITKQLIFDGRKNKVLNSKINLSIPIVLFHGSQDNVVPLNFSKKILKVCKKSKKKLIKIKKGDHSLSRKIDLKKICSELNYIIKNN